jgi:hypothetical protein
VPYAIISAALFASVDPPDVLLTKLECTALESLVVLTLISDEDPGLVTLLKNPCQFISSLIHLMPLDGLIFGFSDRMPEGLLLSTSCHLLLRPAQPSMCWTMLLMFMLDWRHCQQIKRSTLMSMWGQRE